mgnify:CR=1 FL=1
MTVYMSDLAGSALDKILDKINLSEINNKDLVIPVDELYIYRHVLEKVQKSFVDTGTPRRSIDCTFQNSRVG